MYSRSAKLKNPREEAVLKKMRRVFNGLVRVPPKANCLKIVQEGDLTGLLLSKSPLKWCVLGSYSTSGTHHASVEGIIGGYNINAPKFGFLAAQLRLVTLAEATSFAMWFRRMDTERRDEAQFEEAKKLLLGMGYTLRRKSL